MGYTFLRRRIKFIAYILLFNIVFNLLQPLSAYALTSGPAQPESQSFQPAGVSDMVDLFSGDFKYNIPLMDVDGYPLNLNYQSGVGMDDEASWVGLGWNLNVGSISRQLRGVPDDFNGDTLITTHSVKEKVTVGGRLTAKVELKGKAKLGGSFSFGVFSDNYTGIGAEIGVNAGMSFSLVNSGILTSSMGLGVLSNTSSGVDITPNISMSIGKHVEEKAMNYAGLSSSLGYNSRSGLKSLTLGTSFGSLNSFSAPGISYNTEPVSPKIQIPYNSTYSSFSFDVGGVAFAVFGGGGGTGYMNKREVAGGVFKNPEYGFLYADLGKNVKTAVQDFIREKENPIINELPNLALPVHTPDIFTYNSQAGSGQFRLYRGGTGVFADNEVTDISKVSTAGYDIGLGLYAHAGFTKFDQTTTNVTRKWTGNNQYLAKGDFQGASKDSLKWEHVFFRKVGEQNIENSPLNGTLFNGNNPISVNINQAGANSMFNTNASFATSNIPTPIINKQQQRKGTVISYLTAKEATAGGLEKGINTYNFIDSATFNAVALANVDTVVLPRVDAFRKAHHISEISVTDQSGGRMVYGIPVYNKKQEEYSFAIGGNNNKNHDYAVIAGNVAVLDVDNVALEPPHNKGIDEYYHKETQPGYASSYLLTAILSPDYVDKEGNGISKDDLGTGIKFRYSRIADFRWRTPYAMKDGSGNFKKTMAVNKGLLADPDDDKGSIIYGEKELYYVHSIESKTQVAYFITEDRPDGLGVVDWKGDINPTVKQKRLKEIRLYSKFDRSKPIKTVKFDYNNELCPNTPNSLSTVKGTGKSTLTRVWFEYGNSKKGKQHQYVFTYGKNDVDYTTMATDRWGTYKSAQNRGSMTNEEFPYTVQNKASADADAALYHLSKIELPTGGIIEVTYEADDYAYVQDKKAAVMTPVEMQGGGGPEVLEGSSGVKIKLGEAPPNDFTPAQKLDWFKNNYLNGSSYLYTKLYVEITKDDKLSYGLRDDFISSYCRVIGVNVDANKLATIDFEKVNEAGLNDQSPISFSAWQKIKNEYPRYAYPGFMNRIKANSVGSSAEAAISAIISAAGNLTELKENFYKKAERKDFAKLIDTSRSFARIIKDTGYKIGGGSRVKKILINDNWKDFTGDNTASAGKYGQSYEYTIDEGGKKISSGVASYEPPVGNDENPLKQPVSYTQKIKGAISNFFELEAPFGESFFPAASVGYSKVTVRDLDANGEEDPNPQTGAIVSEFYTAREFPVRVSVLPIQKHNPKKEQQYSLIKTNSYEEMTLSQGYCIELNDMHGKPRANRVMNKAGAEISSTVYHYSVENEKAEVLKLNNKVDVINSNGTVSEGVYMGRDIELFTDFREQESKNSGQAINIGLDLIPMLFGFPWPIPHWPINGNNEYKRFRSACAVKVIQNYGIVKKVVKTENGSSIATENVAYDGVTGAALVTRTENEFKKSFYSVNMPAYWAYKGMGPAYQNLGTLLENVVTTSTGTFASATFSNFVTPGDELVDISAAKRYWVIETAGAKRLIDSLGNVKQTNIPIAKITRSGYRNVLQPATSTLVCQENPIQGSVFKPAIAGDLSSLKVLNASTSLFDEKWGNNNPYAENLSYDFTFAQKPIVGSPIVRIQKPNHDWQYLTYPHPGPNLSNNPYWNNVYNLASIQANTTSPSSAFTYGYHVCINIPESKTYYIAFGGNNAGNVDFKNQNGYSVWNREYVVVEEPGQGYLWLIPAFLPAGDYNLTIQFGARFTIIRNWIYGGALALYDNSYEEIIDTNNTENLKLVYTSASVIGKQNVNSFNSIFLQPGGTRVNYHYNLGSYMENSGDYSQVPLITCSEYGQFAVNPYVDGSLGNWRPYQTKVYQELRKYSDVFSANTRGVKIENAGYLNTFSPWWRYQTGQWVGITDNKWVTVNTVTLYDKYGQELENRDALNRYSAANFDFNGELPSAVASNARNREIYSNSFEDTKFRSAYKLDIDGAKFTIASSGQSIATLIDSLNGHTGNSSLILSTSGIQLKTKVHTRDHKTLDYLVADATGYKLRDSLGLYPNGFEPMPSKKYIISTWVNDGQATNRNVKVLVTAKGSGAAVSVPLSCKAIVEGWKLLEGTINMSSVAGSNLELTMKSSSGNVSIDDIRIHPFDAHMKSYAYNRKDFKLMAELDENAFATFYEYDEEGSLVRVKKETERGILTIKESRSSYRKRVN